jgi:molecular chaperone HscA
MLKDSIDHARDDVHARALREQQVHAQSMIAATEAALASDGDLLSAEEAKPIRAGVDELRSLAAGNDHRAIKASIDGLNRLTEPFAARRMDRSVQRALAGRKVDELS